MVETGLIYAVGHALAARAIRLNSTGDRERAVAMAKRATNIKLPPSFVLTDYFNHFSNLGHIYATLQGIGETFTEYIDSAIELSEKSLEISQQLESKDPCRMRCLNQSADRFRMRYVRGHIDSNIERSLQYSEQLVKLAGGDDAELPLYYGERAAGFYYLYLRKHCRLHLY